MRMDLKVMRIKSRLNQTEMAEKLGVSVSTYNLIENGRRNGTREFWLKVQQEFNLNDAEVWKMQK